ncbi:MAG: Cyclic 2,3-diphosphoglycerate synthetase [Candidatus Methanofastidiosum methylothiophilum]|uniref:Cyclic 2,3-diphosphoglycerate synthetase n=1 Tax=Candidatus Methanofastidiosum methylothiophilum TaxID=1705564 RepID=A0A150IPK3_9EURY|nr:MAG: Cyclic 2,3-diphosphoglycerate synthetase [Candidatus Methanofastidiosum methylthiophilus]KYC46818.1 MAG: Cyclic 2,3-diphosphoglycerate synthetase [Candidatus Methanofastidiosum methylthiophilus]KYC49256.1 MAG: Cyclic 2,3-diphosphoglycerate synthetase [Candidatus Methanofastidiosum methylthiophilus]
MKKKVIIMGAAGRDFHDFNTYFRDNPKYEVVCFTATQIPDIEDRVYPKELAGSLYPNGIPIYSESRLKELIKRYKVDKVFLSYSDISHNYVMDKASVVLSSCADFSILGPKSVMLVSKKPVISICAVRTGSGKSPTTRKVRDILKGMGIKVVVVRHPMPYGNLLKSAVQRFETYADMDKAECTIEEREEYEPHIENGTVVFAGVDYERILREAEKEADVILWDGGNNDLPFFKPDLHIVIADPLRAGQELTYHPGEANAMMADVIVINKIDSAMPDQVDTIKRNIQKINSSAIIIEAKSPVSVQNSKLIEGKTVLVVEDGPTLTHGNMSFGAGTVAAKKFNAKEIIDPRPWAIGTIKEVFDKFQQLGKVLPAMGYSREQIEELETTINNVPCDSVIVGTPIDIGKLMELNKPLIRVKYSLEEVGKPDLTDILKSFKKEKGI